MHVYSNRAVTFTLIEQSPILLTKHACNYIFTRISQIKFKAAVKHDLTLWYEV